MSCLGFTLIAALEGYRAIAYPDAGGWSVGYGTHGVTEGTFMSEPEARSKACEHMREASELIQRTLPVPLSTSESIAYISLIYNIGEGGWLKSRVLRYARKGEKLNALKALSSWTSSKGERHPTLVRRRGIEARFATGCYHSLGSCAAVTRAIASL